MGCIVVLVRWVAPFEEVVVVVVVTGWPASLANLPLHFDLSLPLSLPLPLPLPMPLLVPLPGSAQALFRTDVSTIAPPKTMAEEY